jgi:hypothetical protein
VCEDATANAARRAQSGRRGGTGESEKPLRHLKIQRNQNRIRQDPPSPRWNILESEMLLAGTWQCRRGQTTHAPAQPHTIHTRLQQYTCTRYSKKVRHVRAKLRALVAPARRAPRQHRRGHSPAHARARAALRSHKHMHDSAVPEALALRAQPGAAPVTARRTCSSHCTSMHHGGLAAGNVQHVGTSSAHLTYSEFDPTTQCPRRS